MGRQRFPNLAKVVLAVFEDKVEAVIGKDAIQEIKSPVAKKELHKALVDAGARAEKRLIADSIDEDIIIALGQLPIHSLEKLKSVLWEFYENPASSQLYDAIQEQVGLIIPKGIDRTKIASVASKYARYFWEEAAQISELNQKLNTISTIRTEHYAAQIVDSLDRLEKHFTEESSPKKSYPDLKTLNFLPPRPTLIGRESEIAKINQLLQSGKQIIAITGVGGIGKTTLALEIAHQQVQVDKIVIWGSAIEGGARNIDDIESSVWKAVVGGVCKLRSQERREWFLKTLTENKIFIVLDNLEDAEDPSDIFQLLSQFPRPSNALITTREHISPTLGISLVLDRLPENDAIALFEHVGKRLNRRAENDEEREIIKVICSSDILDGHPLAIEIAASQWDELPLLQILRGVKTDPMKALIDAKRWSKNQSILRSLNLSFNRLSKEGLTRRLFTRLGVFRSAIEPKTIEDVCEISNSSPHLQILVRKSLVHFDGKRYSLHPVIRMYAREKLKKKSYFEQRVVQYFLDFVKQYQDNFDVLEQEIDGVLAAMEITDTLGKSQKAIFEYLDTLGPFLYTRGYWDALIKRGERALKIAKLMKDDLEVIRYSNYLVRIYLEKGDTKSAIPLVRNSLKLHDKVDDYYSYADTLYLLGVTASDLGNYEKAKEAYRESLNLAQQIGDQEKVIGIYQGLGNIATVQGNYDEARQYYRESMRIKKELGQDGGVAAQLYQLGLIEQEQSNWGDAEQLYREALAIYRKVGDIDAIDTITHMLGTISFQRGNYQEASDLFDESLRTSRRLGNQHSEGLALVGIGIVYHYQYDFDQAIRYYQDALDIFNQLKDIRNIAATLQKLGMIARQQSNLPLAKELCGHSLEISRRLGEQDIMASALHELGVVAEEEANYENAEKFYEESLEINRRLNSLQDIATTLHQVGNLAYLRGDLDKARSNYIESLLIARKIGDRHSIGQSLYQLGLVALAKNRYAKAGRIFKTVIEMMEQLGDSREVANSIGSLGIIATCELRYDDAIQLCQKALSMRKELHDKKGGADSTAQIGRILLSQEKYDDAQSMFEESLTIYESIGLLNSPNAIAVRNSINET